MSKKILSLALVLVCSFALAACNATEEKAMNHMMEDGSMMEGEKMNHMMEDGTMMDGEKMMDNGKMMDASLDVEGTVETELK